ncbi:hypothetical protein B0H34DRAFT_674244 [Crassisporium funariophilum]|nr:hypothetical protein B0H34DRAFT_674244 [Crassisporium funariophilum]
MPRDQQDFTHGKLWMSYSLTKLMKNRHVANLWQNLDNANDRYTVLVGQNIDLLHQVYTLKMEEHALYKQVKQLHSQVLVYYKTHHHYAWSKALNTLESENNIIALCADQWKAEHLFGTHLQNRVNAKNVKSSKSKSAKCKITLEVDEAEPEDIRTLSKRKQIKKLAGMIEAKERDNSVALIAKAKATPAASAIAVVPVLTGPNHVAISLIVVTNKDWFGDTNSAVSGLLDIFKPHISDAFNLLEAMNASPTFGSTPPSENVQAFLASLDTADLNSPLLLEDDIDKGWGHQQYKGWSDPFLCMWKLWKWAGGPILKGKAAALGAALDGVGSLQSAASVGTIDVDDFPAMIVFAKLLAFANTHKITVPLGKKLTTKRVTKMVKIVMAFQHLAAMNEGSKDIVVESNEDLDLSFDLSTSESDSDKELDLEDEVLVTKLSNYPTISPANKSHERKHYVHTGKEYDQVMIIKERERERESVTSV